MEFDKSKVYTALNADEVKVGSKGYFADTLSQLEYAVLGDIDYGMIDKILPTNAEYRFKSRYSTMFNLFYLIEEPKEKKFRPYKDTDEMIEDFKIRYNSYGGWNGKNNPMYSPLIWIKSKGAEKNKYLITRFSDNDKVTMTFEKIVYSTNLRILSDDYTYLDGSPCGIEE